MQGGAQSMRRDLGMTSAGVGSNKSQKMHISNGLEHFLGTHFEGPIWAMKMQKAFSCSVARVLFFDGAFPCSVALVLRFAKCAPWSVALTFFVAETFPCSAGIVLCFWVFLWVANWGHQKRFCRPHLGCRKGLAENVKKIQNKRFGTFLGDRFGETNLDHADKQSVLMQRAARFIQKKVTETFVLKRGLV